VEAAISGGMITTLPTDIHGAQLIFEHLNARFVLFRSNHGPVLEAYCCDTEQERDFLKTELLAKGGIVQEARKRLQ
jgi:hypothetical protein